MDYFLNGRYIHGKTGRDWRTANQFSGSIHRNDDGTLTGTTEDQSGVQKLTDITLTRSVSFTFTRVCPNPAVTFHYDLTWNESGGFWEGTYSGAAEGVVRCVLHRVPDRFFAKSAT